MYFMLVWILSLILTSFCPHYDPTLVPFQYDTSDPTPTTSDIFHSDPLRQIKDTDV